MAKYHNPEVHKSIALFKAQNPEYSIRQIAEIFNLPQHVVRYAIDKYVDDISLLMNNSKGTAIANKVLCKYIDETQELKNQISLVITQLHNNDKLSPSNRINLLRKVVSIKKMLQSIELQNHLSRVDAEIIKAIILRFLPKATDEDIIKIYNEEVTKLKNK